MPGELNGCQHTSISPEVIIHGNQQAILSNMFNKAQFIDMLTAALRNERHDVYQIIADADMIVQNALESARESFGSTHPAL